MSKQFTCYAACLSIVGPAPVGGRCCCTLLSMRRDCRTRQADGAGELKLECDFITVRPTWLALDEVSWRAFRLLCSDVVFPMVIMFLCSIYRFC